MWKMAFAAGKGLVAMKSILMPVALIGLSGVLAVTVHAMTSGAAAKAELSWVRESANRLQQVREREQDNSAFIIEEARQARAELEALRDELEQRKPEIPEEGVACPRGCTISF